MSSTGGGVRGASRERTGCMRNPERFASITKAVGSRRPFLLEGPPRLSRRGLSKEVFPAFGGVLTRVDGPAEPRCAGRNGRPGPGSGTGCAYYAYNIYV